VGSQSRGKSTLIESMPGLNFNFCGNDIASRFPINFTMISDGACRSPAWRIGKFAVSSKKNYKKKKARNSDRMKF
jgi:hypothetical protein